MGWAGAGYSTSELTSRRLSLLGYAIKNKKSFE